METLLQLLQTDGQNTFLPLVDIRDVPRFPWRGVLLDSARHFLPLPDILHASSTAWRRPSLTCSTGT